MNYKRKTPITLNKINVLIIGSAFITLILIIRLFSIQVIDHDYYQTLASKEQLGYMELPAQRGEIIIKDYNSGEEFPIATNTTLNLVYADPTLIKDPSYIAKQLAPLLLNIEEERAMDNERIEKLAKTLPKETTEEEKIKLLTPLTDARLEENFSADFLKKISERKREKITLTNTIPKEKAQSLKLLNLAGIEISGEKVYAYPPKIISPFELSNQIADYVEIPSKKLSQLLKGENRYVILKRKLPSEISGKIKTLVKQDKQHLFDGIGLKEEYFRYYPEGTLAANILGYVDKEGVGQYGIESSFNTQLQGVAGKFQTKKDSIGRQITVGESILEPAKDGDKIVMTIDRSVQLKVEKILEAGVKNFQADSGQAIILNPKTGAVIAMVNYPTFDPNNYSDTFKKVEINLTPEEIGKLEKTKQPNTYYFYTGRSAIDRYLVFQQQDEMGKTHYFRYTNFVGAEAFQNKIVGLPYEPGSAFKPIVMSMGIDDGDITPNTTYNDTGPVSVDYNKYTGQYDYEIKNSTGYYGLVDMYTVIEKSLNTGMTFVSKKIGPALFYSYLKKYGILDKTDIEFDNETLGKVEYFEKWSESELATHAFGQGLTTTMLQIANAYSVIANGGLLMKPYIVSEIRHFDGTKTIFEPQEIRRVISEDTSAKMIDILTKSGEIGFANKGRPDHHKVGAKTGTSQTYKGGKALFGIGTTIGTYAGFGPVNDPKFVILVKYDLAKSSVWGSDTAADSFKKIAEYLFDYYNIPPDR